jgi:peroxin-6
VPDLSQRKLILSHLTKNKVLNRDISVDELAVHTASYTCRDLNVLLDNATRISVTRAMKLETDITNITFMNDYLQCGIAISKCDFESALKSFNKQSTLGAPKIPSVKWEDIGGLISVKREILDTVQFPLEHPELFAPGLKQRSGVLLYGPPGTGKTLLAKAVATECSLNFISVKGPELINMYVGESEKNIRDVFQRARDAKPCVIFFDELDSLAPNRGRSGDSGGVMDRVVSQLLAELSSINQAKDVFIIGATNRPDLIDPSLLVPGRLDKLLYLGVADDKDSQENILRALTRKFHLTADTDLNNVVKYCPNNLTGADFYALAADAFAIALNELVEKIESLGTEEVRKYQSGDKTALVQVSEENFFAALKKLTPSVSQSELERYKSLQSKYQKKVAK